MLLLYSLFFRKFYNLFNISGKLGDSVQDIDRNKNKNVGAGFAANNKDTIAHAYNNHDNSRNRDRNIIASDKCHIYGDFNDLTVGCYKNTLV